MNGEHDDDLAPEVQEGEVETEEYDDEVDEELEEVAPFADSGGDADSDIYTPATDDDHADTI